jgi:hypothetical protein
MRNIVLTFLFVLAIVPQCFASEVEKRLNPGTVVLGINDLLKINHCDGGLYSSNKQFFNTQTNVCIDVQSFVYRGFALGWSFSISDKEDTIFTDPENIYSSYDFIPGLNTATGPTVSYFFHNAAPLDSFISLNTEIGYYNLQENDYYEDVFTGHYLTLLLQGTIGSIWFFHESLGVSLSYSFGLHMQRLVKYDPSYPYLKEYRDDCIWGYKHSLNMGFKFLM